MDSNIIIDVKDISVRFNLATEKTDNLKEYAIKLVNRQLFYKEFWALQGISFQVNKGENIGIIGYNGSGKSTLLKVIAGVIKPSKGGVSIRGNMAPLIELGAGFDANMTGEENIYLNGAILGYKKEYLRLKYQEIIDFAELKDFIKIPIKNYSSGMKARLGFSIATAINPQILIVDEVLSVGDYKFQEKCQNKIKEMINKGVTVLFVSHSIQQVQDLCTKVIWIDKGRVKMMGPAKEVCQAFLNDK